MISSKKEDKWKRGRGEDKAEEIMTESTAMGLHMGDSLCPRLMTEKIIEYWRGGFLSVRLLGTSSFRRWMYEIFCTALSQPLRSRVILIGRGRSVAHTSTKSQASGVD